MSTPFPPNSSLLTTGKGALTNSAHAAISSAMSGSPLRDTRKYSFSSAESLPRSPTRPHIDPPSVGSRVHRSRSKHTSPGYPLKHSPNLSPFHETAAHKLPPLPWYADSWWKDICIVVDEEEVQSTARSDDFIMKMKRNSKQNIVLDAVSFERKSNAIEDTSVRFTMNPMLTSNSTALASTASSATSSNLIDSYVEYDPFSSASHRYHESAQNDLPKIVSSNEYGKHSDGNMIFISGDNCAVLCHQMLCSFYEKEGEYPTSRDVYLCVLSVSLRDVKRISVQLCCSHVDSSLQNSSGWSAEKTSETNTFPCTKVTSNDLYLVAEISIKDILQVWH